MVIEEKKFNLIPFLLFHAVACLLFFSWLSPITRPFWDAVDTHTFLYLNAWLQDNHLVQIFWAIGNVRAVDLAGAIFMIWFLTLYVLDGKPGQERTHRICKMMVLVIWGELGILLTKQVIDRIIQNYHLFRDSPTIFYTHAVMLSEAIPWLPVKDFSRSCFPGDHAEIVIQWLLFISVLCGKRYVLKALPIGIFFVLPRLIGGAHWLSDALCGSLPIALVVCAWGCYSPLYYYTSNVSRWSTQFLLRKRSCT